MTNRGSQMVGRTNDMEMTVGMRVLGQTDHCLYCAKARLCHRYPNLFEAIIQSRLFE
jgi:hypothetical protein